MSVTVVIPCYNHGRFVRRAVDSALAQEGADVRVVIVDDGSDDGASPAACDRCVSIDPARVSVRRQENRGLPAARNAGAAGATTEYLVFLDADDWIEPAFTARLSAALVAAASPEVSHAYCQERLVGRQTGVWRVPDWDPMLMLITNLHPVTALVRRSCFEAAAGFDETMTGGYEDWDFWLRMVERGWRGVRVREPLFVWRRHSDATMIGTVGANHEALYRRLVAQHAGLFERHSPELLARMNAMLRRFEMNWLDESGEPINLLALKGQREMYESMAAVRLHRALHRTIGSMPRPLAAGIRRILGALKRLAPGGGRPAGHGSN